MTVKDIFYTLSSMKINYAIALCAVPALVQIVSAEEASKIDQYAELAAKSVEIGSKYSEILNAVMSKKVTPAEAAPLVEELVEPFLAINTEMQKVAATMSPEEHEELYNRITNSELGKTIDKLIETMEPIEDALIETDYFASPELKAACEKLDKAAG